MAVGDFGDVLGSATFPQIESIPPNLRKRTANVALLLTQAQAAGYIFLRSLAIDDAGEIDGTPIDTFQIETYTHRDMGLLHWLDDVFAVYSNDHWAHSHLWTVGCDHEGEIADSPIDYLALSDKSNANRRSDLIKPHDGILLTGPPCSDATQPNQTVAITNAGIMPDSVADSMELPNNFLDQKLRHGAGDRIICLASSELTYYIYSFTCTDAGVLPAAPSDSWGPISTFGTHMALCKISDTVFAVFVKDGATDAQIHTFSIKPNGDINKSWIDSEQVEAAVINHPHMMEMGRGYFVLAYTMAAPNRRLKTYFIAPDGTIQDGQLDSKDLATGNRGNPFFEHLNGDIWTLTYEDALMSVRVDTIDITSPGATRPHNELTLGTGP